jgi:hypothetical protein
MERPTVIPSAKAATSRNAWPIITFQFTGRDTLRRRGEAYGGARIGYLNVSVKRPKPPPAGVVAFVLALALALIVGGLVAMLGAEGPIAGIVAGVVLLAVLVVWLMIVRYWPSKRIKGKKVEIPLPDPTGLQDVAPPILRGEVVGTTGQGWDTEAIVRLQGKQSESVQSERVTAPIAALEFPNLGERVRAGLPRQFSHALPEDWEKNLDISETAVTDRSSHP